MASQGSFKVRTTYNGVAEELLGGQTVAWNLGTGTTLSRYQLPDRRSDEPAIELFLPSSGEPPTIGLRNQIFIGANAYQQLAAGWIKAVSSPQLTISPGGVVTSFGRNYFFPGNSSTVYAVGPIAACGNEQCQTVSGEMPGMPGLGGGQYKLTVLVSQSRNLVVRRVLSVTWPDGKTLEATAEFYDYGVPNDIKAPL